MKKTLTQVVLPIAAVGLLAFGITWIINHTSGGKKADDGAVQVVVPIKFTITLAAIRTPTVQVPDEGMAAVHVWHWRDQFEVGQEGHFDFWFVNTHAKEASIRIEETNCQCAGAKLGIVSPDAWEKHVQTSLIAGSPFSNPLIALVSAVELPAKVTWKPLIEGSDKPTQTIPPAHERGPQVGLLRLSWIPKAEPSEGRTVTAKVITKLSDSNARRDEIKAQFYVLDSFRLYSQTSKGLEVVLGSLNPFATPSGEFICWSSTRPELNLIVEKGNLGDRVSNVEWSKPERLTDDELQALTNTLLQNGFPTKARSAYRVKVKVFERRDVQEMGRKVLRQLDLGPLDMKIDIRDVNSGVLVRVALNGVVKGDIRLAGPSVEQDRFNLGEFESTADCVRNISIFGNRPGLEVELLEADTTPSYLKPKLTEVGTSEDGRKEWKLQVVVPTDSLVGPIPDGAVFLRTKEPIPRRIRIPIIGKAKSDLPRG